MSCGGSALLNGDLGSCGCTPGTSAHESYKGSDGAARQTFNYAVSMRYAGNDSPLPKTQTGRSYAAERIYVSTPAIAEPERVYSISRDAPRTFSPTTIESVVGKSEHAIARVERYDSRDAIRELTQLDDVYAKQRLLENRIAQAFLPSQSISDVLRS
jgi:hypothetical protein